MTKKLLTGNEAVARGFWEAGGRVAVAYPGTPSTEITENAAKYEEIHAEWTPNEKVALEVGLGAAIGGARSLVSMKHVGLNVAADPLFTAAYTGINAGLVVVSADDPGMHSSQNEQDNRHYGRSAKLPVLEPSDSAEALAYTKIALQMSENFDTPVILRLTTRVSHSQSLAETGDREDVALREYKNDMAKYVMIPANARRRHEVVEQHLEDLAEYAETSRLNTVELKDTNIGIICSGAVYQYVKEAMPDVSVLKLGMVYPLPRKVITNFASRMKKLYVIEELDPFIEDIIKSWGIEVSGSDIFSPLGEIFPDDITSKIMGSEVTSGAERTGIPGRPPVMCAGCPHRGAFYAMKKLGLVVSGDIGCYTLGCLPPLSSMHSCICMGASIGVAHGLEKAQGRKFAKKTVAVLGESTFIHSGITGLINVVYNQSAVTTIILDNSTTAMTGHQHNPATGYNAKGAQSPVLDLEAMVKACGVEKVTVVDPLDVEAFAKVLRESLDFDGPAVIISRRPCVLLDKKSVPIPFNVDNETCIGCFICLKTGCPALEKKDNKAFVNPNQCVGCGLCSQVCPIDAISSKTQANLEEKGGAK